MQKFKPGDIVYINESMISSYKYLKYYKRIEPFKILDLNNDENVTMVYLELTTPQEELLNSIKMPCPDTLMATLLVKLTEKIIVSKKFEQFYDEE